ncbi:MAG: hypothetical protein ABI910_16695 [Gemmatimonadota bacterium]
MTRRRTKGRGARQDFRRVGPRDTAATPLPARYPVRRLWTLLAAVLMLAVAALLSVYRPWTGDPRDAGGDNDQEVTVEG